MSTKSPTEIYENTYNISLINFMLQVGVVKHSFKDLLTPMVTWN